MPKSKYKSIQARYDEIARLVALGVPTRDIQAQVGLSRARICQIVNQIEGDKIAELSGQRDKSTAQLQEQMMKERIALAADIWESLRTEYDAQKDAKELSTKLCFDILDRTEGIPAKKLDINTHDGLFSKKDIEDANKVSGDIDEPTGK